jgi:hypothetical protein
VCYEKDFGKKPQAFTKSLYRAGFNHRIAGVSGLLRNAHGDYTGHSNIRGYRSAYRRDSSFRGSIFTGEGLTDALGQFVLQTEPNNAYTLKFEDIDGADNGGQFATKEITVDSNNAGDILVKLQNAE